MRSSQTFAILFWINTSRIKNNKAQIFARVTINQKRANISLKREVEVSKWDSSKSKVKGNSSEARNINNYIEQVRSGLFKAYQDLTYEDENVTAKLVKSRYLGLDVRYHSLLELFEYHNKLNEGQLSKATYSHYKTTQSYLKTFLSEKYKTTDVFLKDINYQMIIDFELFLSKHKYGSIKINTIAKHLQRFKKMFYMAMKLDWIAKNPFISYKFKTVKPDREYLTQDELNSIIEYKFTIERLQNVKDLFLFSCYTGLAYVDIRNLTSQNLAKGIDGNTWIITKRQKTGTSVKVPLLEPAENILNSYTENLRVLHSKKLLPGISNQKVNSYLKEIADCCGITKNLTFHMARHTFATTVTLSNGIPIETVSKMLGHTKLTTTQIYAKIIDKKVSEDMQILQDKYSKQKLINIDKSEIS
ncbi:site-specific integrase [Ochrovirga pacifica]|uniref:site-specific integrase n=1 Tax=Ochrovirga pacifica TaxID=1042376 RepID=UPI0002558B3E|nr:site-specific integrase [Ochrovirga pacifica]